MTTAPREGTAYGQLSPIAPVVWLLWDCTDPVGIFTSEEAAQEARADLQHQILCQYGPKADLLESTTITTAHVPTAGVGADRGHR